MGLLVFQACRVCFEGVLTFVMHEWIVCNDGVTKPSYIRGKKCIHFQNVSSPNIHVFLLDCIFFLVSWFDLSR